MVRARILSLALAFAALALAPVAAEAGITTTCSLTGVAFTYDLPAVSGGYSATEYVGVYFRDTSIGSGGSTYTDTVAAGYANVPIEDLHGANQRIGEGALPLYVPTTIAVSTVVHPGGYSLSQSVTCPATGSPPKPAVPTVIVVVIGGGGASKPPVDPAAPFLVPGLTMRLVTVRRTIQVFGELRAATTISGGRVKLVLTGASGRTAYVRVAHGSTVGFSFKGLRPGRYTLTSQYGGNADYARSRVVVKRFKVA